MTIPGLRVHHVSSRDGARIAVFTSGRGPDLLLVHGTTDTSAIFAGLRRQLDRDFTVHAMDRRGHGESGNGPAYALEREFEDVAAVVDAIERKVVLFAHSFGGICGLGGASLTEGLSHLVLYEPPIATRADTYPPSLAEAIQADFDAGRHEAVIANFFTEVVQLPPPLVERMRRLPDWPARVATAANLVREMYAVYAYRFQPERHGRLTVPTRLLQGELSPAYLKEATAVLASGITGATLEVLPGQRHAAISAAPDVIAAHLRGFVQRQAPAAVSARPRPR